MKNFDEQIAKVEKQIRKLNNKKKRLISEQKQAERQATDKAVNRARGDFGKRNRQCGGFSNEQLQALLIEIFSSESMRAKAKNLREHTADGGNPLF